MKCSCCGCDRLVAKNITAMGNGAMLGAMKIVVNGSKCEPVRKARICMDCGNIMPFVNPDILLSDSLRDDTII